MRERGGLQVKTGKQVDIWFTQKFGVNEGKPLLRRVAKEAMCVEEYQVSVTLDIYGNFPAVTRADGQQVC